MSGTEMLTTLELEGMKCEVVQQVLPNTISFVRFELSADDGVISKSKVRHIDILSNQSFKFKVLINVNYEFWTNYLSYLMTSYQIIGSLKVSYTR